VNPVKIILGFVPFLLFSVLAHWLDIGWTALVCLGVALLLVAVTARGGLKILPVVQAVILAVIAIIAFVGGSGVDRFLELNARGGASVVLGLFIVATASIAPFTENFAKESVAPEYWHTARFRAVNRRISLAWGVAVFVVGVSHIVGAHLDNAGAHHLVVLAVDWIIPVLAVLRAITFTRTTAASAAALARG
jgi:energy-coupling factor transporter transmembrane protein EcfT